MPTNPYESPKEVNEGRPRGLTLKAIGISVVAVVAYTLAGGILAFAAFLAMAILVAAAGLAFRVSIGPWGGWMLAGMIVPLPQDK